MKLIILNLRALLECVWRLIWLPAPDVRTRLTAISESTRLFEIYQKLRTPFWLQTELKRLTSEVSPPIESVDESVIETYLAPLKLALIAHPTAACLERSIRILQILRAKGVYSSDVTIKIGIRRASVNFRGHAWVEYRGKPLLNLPVLGQGYGYIGQPVVDIPNLLIPKDEYDYVWEGEELINDEGFQNAQDGSKYKIKGCLIVKQLGDEDAVILDLIDGTCFGLDPVSYVVWKELARTGTPDAGIRQISETSGVDIATVKADIEELLGHLMEVGLIEGKT